MGSNEGMSSRPRIHILLIGADSDDNRLIPDRLAQAEGADFDVQWTQSLSEGLGFLNDNKTDVVLLSLSLPDSPGIEALTRLKGNWPQLPVVALKDNDGIEIESICVSGADSYILSNQLSSDLLEYALIQTLDRYKFPKAVEHGEHYFRALIENSVDGIVLLGANGVVLYESPSLKRMLGINQAL